MSQRQPETPIHHEVGIPKINSLLANYTALILSGRYLPEKLRRLHAADSHKLDKPCNILYNYCYDLWWRKGLRRERK